MNIPKELIDQWWAEWHSEGRIQPVLEYIAQRAAEWALSNVSMEPACEVSPYDVNTICWNAGHADAGCGSDLFTATQLAAARQQGAEEAYKDANMQTYKDAIKQVRKLSERIADLEKSNAQLLEALQPFVLANSSEEHMTLVVRTADITKARAAIEAAEVKP